MSTTPSYLIRSKTMLRVMKTPVLPTPALCKRGQRGQRWGQRNHINIEKVCSKSKHHGANWIFVSIYSICSSGNVCVEFHFIQNASDIVWWLCCLVTYLQWTEIGPSWPNCSFVLCTWPMKSMKPSPDFGTPCSGQSVNWNCLTVRDCPSCQQRMGREKGGSEPTL